MAYRIVFTESYSRRAIRFIRKHPEVRRQYEKTLQLLELNPFHPSLRLHRLKGRLKDLHSASITLQYRITVEFLIDGTTIIPVAVGSHDDVY
jgi:proteic killer suppression protein